MKKKLLLILIIAFAIIGTSSIFAAETPGLYYDFYYEWDESWEYIPADWSGSMCDLEYSNNAIKVNMHGMDPSFNLEVRESIDLAEYPFIKIRVKNESTRIDKFEMYLAKDSEGLSENGNFRYEIGTDHKEFKDFIIDAKAVKGDWWTGELTTLRLDCLPLDEGEVTFYLEYIAFFKTQADAEAWAPDRSQTPAPTPEPTPTSTPSPEPTEKATATNDKTNGSDTKSGLSTPVIVVSALIIVIAIVVVVLFIKRNKRG